MRRQRGISPNFGVKEFATRKETISFLRRLGFEVLNKRSDHVITWETTKEPKQYAVSLERECGGYVTKQLPEIYGKILTLHSAIAGTKLRTLRNNSDSIARYKSKQK